MPYVRCGRCELVSFSAAYLATVDHCSRCGAELPRPLVVGPPLHARRPVPGRQPLSERA